MSEHVTDLPSLDGADDAAVSRQVAIEAGRILLALRASYGELDLADRETADRLRKEADRASHLHIVARLAEARPEDSVLSEEGADDAARLSAARVWIVDPLDGTWEYGQGRADFAVHIALWVADPSSAVRGRLVASTVELPAQGLTRCSTDPADGSRALPLARPIRIVASRTRPPATLGRACEILSDSIGRPVEVVDVGSVGAKVNEILCGRADAYVHDTGFYEWDVAAPYLIAENQGLAIGHVGGAEVAFNLMPPKVTSLRVARPDLVGALDSALEAAARDE